MDKMPDSDAAMEGGTNGSMDGISMAALRRGYVKSAPLPCDEQLYQFGPDYFVPVTTGWVER